MITTFLRALKRGTYHEKGWRCWDQGTWEGLGAASGQRVGVRLLTSVYSQ